MSLRKHLVIALDGPAGSGKSTTAKMLAQRLKLPYIDTGAMYRSVTLKAMRAGVDLRDAKALAAVARGARIRLSAIRNGRQRVYLDGKDVTKAIRTAELTQNVFYVAREPRVRTELVKQQRRFGRRSGAVMEGRDIGTVVFPKADYKFFLNASVGIRTLRRWRELKRGAKRATPAQVRRDIIRRDRYDRTRKVGALRVAKGAYTLDTSALTIKQTVDRILATIEARRKGGR